MDWVITHENALRLGSFSVGFIFFFLAGLVFSFRNIASAKRLPNWGRNMLIIVSNSLVLRLLLPISLTGLALHAANDELGAFNMIVVPVWLEIIISLVLLDMLIYWQHRIFHISPLLWRLHRLHHTDVEFDVTTAGRFHPVEIFLSYLLKAVAVVFFGIAPAVIIVYEIILNLFALFNHSNFSFPATIERWIRALIVTPSMHRIHHSTKPAETNSNYGNCLSCWDRLFSSYTDHSSDNPKNMPLGLNEFRSPEDQKLLAIICQPFKSTERKPNLDS